MLIAARNYKNLREAHLLNRVTDFALMSLMILFLVGYAI